MPKRKEIHIKDLNLTTEQIDEFFDNLHIFLIEYDTDYSIDYEINELN